MVLLWIIAAFAWAALAFKVRKGAWSAVFGEETRRGDPMQLGVFAVCIMLVLGTLRYILGLSSDAAIAFIHSLSLMTCGLVWKLTSSYGRGPRV